MPNGSNICVKTRSGRSVAGTDAKASERLIFAIEVLILI